ncbi:MAG: hypothetical protein J6W00_10940 [Lentisphaeria bacterium]|nr:hypothetical protein [Lentisphaeria bacterium]
MNETSFDARERWIKNRVTLPTKLSSRAIAERLMPKIRAQAFFSARVAEARIAEAIKEISDRYSMGEIEFAEARTALKRLAVGNNLDDGSSSLKNLGSLARIDLILQQNALMAAAVGQYEAGMDPDIKERFPCWRYIASTAINPRDSHAKYSGMVFRKDDPIWHKIFPPWDFNCKCSVEDCDDEPMDSSKLIPNGVPGSGFAFDPAHAFEEFDVSGLQIMSRQSILKQAEDAVKNQKLDNVGLIVAPAESSIKSVSLHGAAQVRSGFEAMKSAARKELEEVGLNPDDLPDYKAVNEAFAKAGKQGKNIVAAVRDKFPAEPFEVAKLNRRAAEAAGLPDLPVMLGVGNQHHGIEHLWRNHKELFVDPVQAIEVLRDTLGNENCRVVVSLKRAVTRKGEHGNMQKLPICLKRIVLHNPQKQSYCVMVYDGKQLKLVSWNNADDAYGDDEWSLK